MAAPTATTYKLTVIATDDDTVNLLNDANYQLRVGRPPLGVTDAADAIIHNFEPTSNAIGFTLAKGSLTKIERETVVTLTFSEHGTWQYSIGYRLPKDAADAQINYQHDVKLGDLYEVDAAGLVATPKAAAKEDEFVSETVIGVRNSKTVALTLYRRHEDQPPEKAERYQVYPPWLPGIGTIKPVPDSDVPPVIAVWFEHDHDGKGVDPSTHHESHLRPVNLGKNTDVTVFLHRDGILYNVAEDVQAEAATDLLSKGGAVSTAGSTQEKEQDK